MIVESQKAKLTLRYWKASLAWKNVGDWAKGWTATTFIHEVKEICNDNGMLGGLADILLDDMIHDRERTPNETPGELIDIHARVAHIFETLDLGQQASV